MNNPLKGIKVLDLTTLLPGPLCTLILSDLGAEVIKIENPLNPDFVRFIPPMAGENSSLFHCLNRGKKSIALNLKSESGKKIFLELVKFSDCVVEGFRGGVMHRLSLSYNHLKKIKKDIIYCAITGFGQKGDYKNRPGHDITYLAISGLLSLFRDKKPPPVQIADIGGGALNAAISIISALYYREKTKKGSFLDISMSEGSLLFSIPAISEWTITKRTNFKGVRLLYGDFPFYNVYETKESARIAIAALEDKFRNSFIEVIKTISNTRDINEDIIRKTMKMKYSKEWMKIFNENDIPAEIVLSIQDTVEHPAFKKRESFIKIRTKENIELIMPATPFLSHRKNLKPGPSLGEHTDSILKSAKISEKVNATIQTSNDQ